MQAKLAGSKQRYAINFTKLESHIFAIKRSELEAEARARARNKGKDVSPEKRAAVIVLPFDLSLVMTKDNSRKGMDAHIGPDV